MHYVSWHRKRFYKPYKSRSNIPPLRALAVAFVISIDNLPSLCPIDRTFLIQIHHVSFSICSSACHGSCPFALVHLLNSLPRHTALLSHWRLSSSFASLRAFKSLLMSQSFSMKQNDGWTESARQPGLIRHNSAVETRTTSH